MDECPNCKNWTLTYEPQGEVYRCQTCGYTQKESYEVYLKRVDCGKSLLYPTFEAKQLPEASK